MGLVATWAKRAQSRRRGRRWASWPRIWKVGVVGVACWDPRMGLTRTEGQMSLWVDVREKGEAKMTGSGPEPQGKATEPRR